MKVMGLNLDEGHVIAQLSDGMEVFLLLEEKLLRCESCPDELLLRLLSFGVLH